MRRPTTVLAAMAVLSTVVLTGPAAADERTCRGSIGAETVDDLRVPDGATCRLDGTRVEGSIRVGTGSTLVARDVRVDGNVQAEGHRDVDLRSSRVDGSVQLKQGQAATVYRTTIGGDLQYDDNTRRLVAHSNPVGGNIQIVGNTGGVDVSGNRVDGNLQCKENRPAPTGGANTVRGSAEDQCARLTGGSASPAPGSGSGGAGGSGSGGSATFRDTAGSVHAANIEKVAAAGITLGGTDGRFRPNDAVTRGQMASFLQRAEGLPAASSRGFCDTRGTTHERAIDAVAAAGIVEGASGCYRPADAMTRGQMASVLARALEL